MSWNTKGFKKMDFETTDLAVHSFSFGGFFVLGFIMDGYVDYFLHYSPFTWLCIQILSLNFPSSTPILSRRVRQMKTKMSDL